MKLIRLHKMFKQCLFFVLLLVCSSVSAIEVTDLYQAKVAVNSQASKERSQAIRKAMAAVMLKVGGQASVLTNATIKKQLQRYNQFLIQYRYERQAEQLYLVAYFNENKINQLFQQANLPLWGSLRPQVLVWLIEEDNLSRQILSESSESELPTVIANFSETRGLPLLIPLMDLQDNLTVNVADIWGRFSEETLNASQRYFVDTSLIVRISNSSLVNNEAPECEGVLCHEQTKYVIDWSLIAEHQKFGQAIEGTDPKGMLTEVLKEVANVIYQEYALSTDLTNELIIEVANVESLKNYIEITEFLAELSAVESVTLIKAEQEKRTFKLALLGSKKALLSSLKLNDELQQYIDPLAGAEPQEYPIFYWRKQ